MELIWEGVSEALGLLIRFDPLVRDAAVRSLWVSAMAVGFATAIGLPLGTLLATSSFFGRRMLTIAFQVSMAFPTVFVGIVCYAIFSRRGPLGPWELLYTPWAIVCGEFCLALPLVVSISQGAIQSLDSRVADTAWTLGANGLRRWQTYISEARIGVTLAVLTAFSRCITELGVAMLVGGNIARRTRTLATATALETGKGEFGRGMAMAIILFVVAIGVMSLVMMLGRKGDRFRQEGGAIR